MEETTERSKQTALSFITALDTRDYDSWAARFTEDAVWWVLGKPPYVTYGGSMPARERAVGASDLFRQFAEYSLKPYNVVAAGSKVVVEGKVLASTSNGVVYSNDVIMSFEIKDDQILSLREYLDNHAVEAFVKEAAELSA